MASESDYFRLSAKVISFGLIAIVIVVTLATALVRASDIFLILFLAVLFGVFLSRSARLISTHLSIPYHYSLGITTTVLVLIMASGITMFGVQVDAQLDRAAKQADEGVEQIQEWADRYPTVKSVLRSTPFLRGLIEEDQAPNTHHTHSSSADEESAQASSAEQSALRNTAQKGAAAVAGVFKTTFGLLVNSVLIFFVGLFLAASPGEYRDGVVKLFPPQRRERTREVMDLMGNALWDWLIGRFVTMLITGCGAGLLLFVLGVPMALTLGVVTALLTFIPNIGGIVALVLAILFALPKGGTTILLVLLGYIILQLVESYVITPIIQQKQVSVPPALLIAFQAVMGVLFGFLGAAVASPALAAAKVGIEEAYIKDVLEKAR